MRSLILVIGMATVIVATYLASKEKKVIVKKPKPRGYTLIEYGKAINQDGDTIQVEPLNFKRKWKH